MDGAGVALTEIRTGAGGGKANQRGGGAERPHKTYDANCLGLTHCFPPRRCPRLSGGFVAILFERGLCVIAKFDEKRGE